MIDSLLMPPPPPRPPSNLVLRTGANGSSSPPPSLEEDWKEKTVRFVGSLVKKPEVSLSFLRSLTDKASERSTSSKSSATTPFRKYWKTVIEPWTGLVEFPTDKSQLLFKTGDGHIFARGYDRVPGYFMVVMALT